MYSLIKVVVFGLLLSIAKGEFNNKIEIYATCDEVEQIKSNIDKKYC